MSVCNNTTKPSYNRLFITGCSTINDKDYIHHILNEIECKTMVINIDDGTYEWNVHKNQIGVKEIAYKYALDNHIPIIKYKYKENNEEDEEYTFILRELIQQLHKNDSFAIIFWDGKNKEIWNIAKLIKRKKIPCKILLYNVKSLQDYIPYGNKKKTESKITSIKKEIIIPKTDIKDNYIPTSEQHPFDHYDCQGLNYALENSNPHGKGLSIYTLTNLETSHDWDFGIIYRNSPKDRGIMVKFCPFCGKQILFPEIIEKKEIKV